MGFSAVVGGGPAGSLSARALLRKGEVVLFEEHVKQPVQCAGLISCSGLSRLGVDPGSSVLNSVCGARFFSSAGRMVEINAGKKKAYVVDRSRFDEILLQEAVDAGAKLVSERVTRVSKSVVSSKSEESNPELIVLASGVDYSFHRKLGLDHPKRFLVGAQVDVACECDEDFVELHFNVPGFFSWVIPTQDYCRIGLLAKANPQPYLDSFLKQLKKEGRIKSGKPGNRVYGIVPFYDKTVKTDYGWLRLVGDAAGQVKATTGGGVVLGGVAAQAIGEKDYEHAWRKKIGSQLSMHLMARGLIDRISERNIDALLDLIEAGRKPIEEGGDMDYASQTIRSLAGSPRFLMKGFACLPGLALSFL